MPRSQGRPRILFCTDTWPPQVNGVSVVTALSAAGLEARGWMVEVIAPRYPSGLTNPFPRGSGGLDPIPVTSVASLALPIYPDLRLAWPARDLVEGIVTRFAPAVVHSATEFMIGRQGQGAALRQGLPVTSSYHTDFSRYAASYGVPWLRGGVRRYLRSFHRRSARVFTPGRPAAEELRALGVASPVVWGSGVDLGSFHPGRRDLALRRAYAGDDAILFLHVGRLAPEKSIDRILDAFRQARLRGGARHPMHLVIAGAGPSEPALRARADQHVTFLGNLDRATILPRLYASADAFLFASETETLGLVILEAMASGLPVVATPVGGVADHLVHGRNGLAFAAGDTNDMARAILALAADPGLRARLGAGARTTAGALGWDAELDRLDAEYRAIIAPEGGRLSATGHPDRGEQKQADLVTSR